MQPLNPHTLFSIFEKGDEEIYKEHNMEELLDNPFVLQIFFCLLQIQFIEE